MLECLYMSEDDVYGAEEAAIRLGLNRVTVQRWIRAGKLPAEKAAGATGYRIKGADIERLRYQQLAADADKLARVGVACRDAADSLYEHAAVLTGPDHDHAVAMAFKLREMQNEAWIDSELYRDWKGFYRS